jgi:hypothetical protein
MILSIVSYGYGGYSGNGYGYGCYGDDTSFGDSYNLSDFGYTYFIRQGVIV